MSLVSRLAKGASITFTGLFISKVISFLYRITVGRGLGPEKYGYLVIGIASFFLAQNISNISVDSAVARYIPDEPGRTSEYLFSALKVSVPLSVAASAAIFMFAEQLASIANQSHEVVPVMKIMAVGVPFGVLSSSMTTVFQAREKIRYEVYVNQIYQNAFKLMSGLAAVALGLGLKGVTWGFTLSVITSVALAAYYLKTRFTITLPEQTSSKKMVTYSWPLFLSGLMGFVLSWTDSIMIGFFTGSGSQVGIYGAAFPLAQSLTIFMSATATIAFPIMTRLYEQGEKKEMNRLYQTNTRWVIMFTAPAFLLTALFPREILLLTFGEQYLPAADALRLLSSGVFASTLVGPAQVLLKSTDNQRYSLYNSVFATAVNVAANFALIPVFGILGAAYASIASTLITNLSAAAEAYYEEGIQGIHTGLIPAFASSGISVAVTYTAINVFRPVTPLWTLIPGFVLFGVMYAVSFVLAGGLNEEDRQIIVGAGRKLGVKEEAEYVADTIIR